jgi:hypothetical protein
VGVKPPESLGCQIKLTFKKAEISGSVFGRNFLESTLRNTNSDGRNFGCRGPQCTEDALVFPFRFELISPVAA